MPIEIAKAAIEKYAAERDPSGARLLQEVIATTMGPGVKINPAKLSN